MTKKVFAEAHPKEIGRSVGGGSCGRLSQVGNVVRSWTPETLTKSCPRDRIRNGLSKKIGKCREIVLMGSCCVWLSGKHTCLLFKRPDFNIAVCHFVFDKFGQVTLHP